MFILTCLMIESHCNSLALSTTAKKNQRYWLIISAAFTSLVLYPMCYGKDRKYPNVIKHVED